MRIGVLSSQTVPEPPDAWRRLESLLDSAVPGRRFSIESMPFDALEADVASRRLDFVLTNPAHYVRLRHRFGLSAPLATRTGEFSGEEVTVFGGVIVVRTDRADTFTLADIADQRVAAVHPFSTGGFLAQARQLALAGYPVPANVLETGLPHARVVDAVLSGEADVGFLRSGVLEFLIEQGRMDARELRVVQSEALWGLAFDTSTRLYPEWPLAAMPLTEHDLARRVAAVLFSVRDPALAPPAAEVGGFTVPADYSVIEDLLRELGVAPFDTEWPVTLQDVWREYRLAMLLSAVLFAFLGVFSALLVIGRRRLRYLQDIVERSPAVAISWRHEPGWPITFVSRNIAQFGYAAEHLASGRTSFLELIHPDDRERVTNEIARQADHGADEYQHNYRLRHGEGRWIRVEDYTRLVRNRAGHVTALGGILWDVTERYDAEIRVAHVRDLMRYVIEHNRSAVAVHDIDLNYVYVSQKYLESFGLQGEEIIGRHHYEVFPDLPQRLRDVHQRVLKGEVLSAEDDPWLNDGGTLDWTRWECRPWFDVEGLIGGIIVYTEIITERKQAELELREKTAALARTNQRLEQLATVFTSAREGILITDVDGRIIEVNDAFGRITGYDRDEVIGRNAALLNSGRQTASFDREMKHSLESKGFWAGELWNQRKTGEIYPQSTTATSVRDKSGQTVHYVFLFSDVSEQKQHERQLEHATQYDRLTGLPNRSLLTDRLEQAMAQAQRHASGLVVVYLDADDFKSVNERYGQSFGDRVLCRFAQRVQDWLRAGDSVARFGGDELVVVLTGLDCEADAKPLLDSLLQVADESLGDDLEGIRLSVSLGATFYRHSDEADADQLLRQADQAMYRAKLAGKRRYLFFDHAEDIATRGVSEALQRIREGLVRNEFVLFYQPRVNMRTGVVLGAEALIRWQHPERGLLAPAQFLPMIEHEDLALDVGEWVIEQALAQLAAWTHQGLALSVSVNVFARQLQQENFVEALQSALQCHPGVVPTHFEIEVLETSALDDMGKVSALIERCQAIGVQCALDDFGTGYSSLSYLKSLPAAVLKIDQSFVRDMLDDPNDLAILNGVLGLARAFERVPVAEGVETVRHGEILLDLGCDLAQGYGIARPMPAEELPLWMQRWAPSASWLGRVSGEDAQLRLLFATVEHRGWVADVARCVQSGGRRPELDAHGCAFGRWLEHNAPALHLEADELEALHALHHEVHQAGRQLAKGGFKSDEIGPELVRLYALRDRLVQELGRIESALREKQKESGGGVASSRH